MSERKELKISLSTFLLILSIIAIIIMAYFIYNLNNEKIAEIEKSKNLNTEISNLQNTVNKLQDKIDTISNTINSNSSTNNISPEGNTNTLASSDEISKLENISTNNINLKIGNYTVNEVLTNKEDGHSNSECGVYLKQNNKFEIYMGWGASLTGSYKIQGTRLICSADTRTWQDGDEGSRVTNVIISFEIENSNKLKLTDININDTNSEKLIYDDGLKVGMTYSIK